MKKHNRVQDGFSLVELSIVLVILGLLVGGVLSGQSLMRAAQLRSVTTQLQAFTAAHMSFKDKYMAIAGDMANATQFWGQVPIVTFCSRDQGTGTQTCNGDGDGFIDASGNGAYNEPARYWQHLVNAGMITGGYTGVGANGSGAYTDANNSPSSKITNSLWMPYSDASNSVEGRLHYVFGGQSAAAIANPNAVILRPEDLWNIDKKLDDGYPNTGNVQGSYTVGSPNNCNTGTTATDTYLLTYGDVGCYAYFYF